MFKRVVALITRKQQPQQHWYPPALRLWNLGFATLLCWIFIALLHGFLVRSKRNGGVLFAPDVNDLPLSRTFSYRYLPTIIAVRQLTEYSHWLVFWGSSSTLIAAFGIVPFQAGIFSVVKTTRTSEQRFLVSQSFIRSDLQTQIIDINSAQSAYGFLNLNETLPEYTAFNYTLSPFSPSGAPEKIGSIGIWTANTTLFGMDLQCHSILPWLPESHNGASPANINNETGMVMQDVWYNISSGCTVKFYRWSPIIYGGPTRKYNSFTSSPCFTWGTIFAFFQRNRDQGYKGANRTMSYTKEGRIDDKTIALRNNATDPFKNVTAIACKPFYYKRQVEADVDAKTKTPIETRLLGPKVSLPEHMFNNHTFSSTLFPGSVRARFNPALYGPINRVENRLPDTQAPQYISNLRLSELTRPDNYSPTGEPSPLTAMALLTSARGMDEFLDSRILAEAHEKALRLLFVLKMNTILKPNISSSAIDTSGRWTQNLEAVVLEPAFTYTVEVLLALVSLSIGALAFLTTVRMRNTRLCDDPGSIATIMSLVADNTSVLHTFATLDCCTESAMAQVLGSCKFKFSDSGFTCVVPETTLTHQQSIEDAVVKNNSTAKAPTNDAPIRPSEFRLYTAIPFTGLFIVLFIGLAILWAESHRTGLPLPSTNQIIQNLVMGYLPTAIAMLIEPMWVLLNRLLCVLQPFEDLRSSSEATTSQSLVLNYTALPPQLVALKAFRAKHFVLAVVATMALLSNLLATSFAGLLFQNTILVAKKTSFQPVFTAQLLSSNGSAHLEAGGLLLNHTDAGSGPYIDGITDEEQLLILESNYTRNTTLPSWLGETAAYLPFKTNGDIENGQILQAQTTYPSSTSGCRPLMFHKDFELVLWSDGQPFGAGFKVSVYRDNGPLTTCYASSEKSYNKSLSSSGLMSMPNNLGYWSSITTGCFSGQLAGELLLYLQAAEGATQLERDTCATAFVVGWLRTTVPPCVGKTPITRNQTEVNWKDATKDNTLLVLCQPQLSIGTAEVRVDPNGVLLDAPTNVSIEAAGGIQLSNTLFGPKSEPLHDWHNNSFASEHLHYFANRARGDVRLTDPHMPLPTFSDVEKALEKAIARLFATWAATNLEKLFLPATDATEPIQGQTITEQKRLFFRMPLLIISEVILGIYILVSILVFVRRPGRYLPRLPTSIAAVIALFASSAAVQDLQGTSHMTNKEREKHLKDLDHRYRYGSYIGSDGAVHVGIEKVPYVQYMKEVTFRGSRSERETRKRREVMSKNRTSPAISSAENSSMSLPEDVEEVRGHVGSRTVGSQPPSDEHTHFRRRPEDERSISPLEDVSFIIKAGQGGETEGQENNADGREGAEPASSNLPSMYSSGYQRIPLDE
ncbi:hypothetical protein SVAN01_04516 [Stagonosporopsis vannaccii]|nr:hypothetical protein SVAN01_04516 [Stagonosporopsis vannaccii]